MCASTWEFRDTALRIGFSPCGPGERFQHQHSLSRVECPEGGVVSISPKASGHLHVFMTELRARGEQDDTPLHNFLENQVSVGLTPHPPPLSGNDTPIPLTAFKNP